MEKKIARFIVEIPIAVDEQLRAEAQREGRSRVKQVLRVLEERYGFVENGVEQQAANAA